MRIKSLAVCLLFFAVALPMHADTITNYTITFTISPGYAGRPTPTSGSFSYDSTIPDFSNFLVTWNGVTFDLTASANATTLGNTGCTGESSTPSYSFALLSQALTGCTISYLWNGTSFPNPSTFYFTALPPGGVSDTINTQVLGTFLAPEIFAQGTWSISPVPTSPVPEPTSLLLVSTGLLGVLIARRKWRPA